MHAANSILFCYYLSPLATLALVLKTRSSASLTLPLCVMNIVNGSLWMTYGLVLSDPFVWVPNAIGAVLGVIQTSLCLAFPSQLIPTCVLEALCSDSCSLVCLCWPLEEGIRHMCDHAATGTSDPLPPEVFATCVPSACACHSLQLFGSVNSAA
jgi:hypothetical protein